MAAAWTDESGAAYLFGGLGYVAPSEGGASPAARLNVVLRPLIDQSVVLFAGSLNDLWTLNMG